jgi:hypothetical protein
MSGLTVPANYPYPTGTDFVRDGDNAIQALAEAAQNAQLTGVRPSDGAAAASTWASLVSASGQMPAGKYLVIANCLWFPAVADGTAGYSWLDARCNGTNVGGQAPFAGVKKNNAPNNTCLIGVVNHGGGTMTLTTEFGFADTQVWGITGSTISAVRLGP